MRARHRRAGTLRGGASRDRASFATAVGTTTLITITTATTAAERPRAPPCASWPARSGARSSARARATTPSRPQVGDPHHARALAAPDRDAPARVRLSAHVHARPAAAVRRHTRAPPTVRRTVGIAIDSAPPRDPPAARPRASTRPASERTSASSGGIGGPVWSSTRTDAAPSGTTSPFWHAGRLPSTTGSGAGLSLSPPPAAVSAAALRRAIDCDEHEAGADPWRRSSWASHLPVELGDGQQLAQIKTPRRPRARRLPPPIRST